MAKLSPHPLEDSKELFGKHLMEEGSCMGKIVCGWLAGRSVGLESLRMLKVAKYTYGLSHQALI